MSKQLFPPEILNHTAEAHFYRNSTSSQIIYITVLLAVIGALVALPFVYVDISVQARGMVTSQQAKTEIYMPVAGEVQAVLVAENQFIAKDAVLLQILAPALDKQLDYAQTYLSRLRNFIYDLKHLCNLDSGSILKGTLKLKTPLYHQAYFHLYEQLQNNLNEIEQSQINLSRNQVLYKLDGISKKELEDSDFLYRSHRSTFQLNLKRQLLEWQQTLEQRQKEAQTLEEQIVKWQKEQERYTVKAPIAGIVQQLGGLAKGSFVHLQQKIAEISPDSNLMVEAYVSPQDIGLVEIDMSARFQIDAFNYNEWGIVTGSISDISKDIILTADNQPMFKVKCQLDQMALSLPSGYSGSLKKGMTLQAKFLVTRRNLYQLLYDKADDWLNPTLLSAR